MSFSDFPLDIENIVVLIVLAIIAFVIFFILKPKNSEGAEEGDSVEDKPNNEVPDLKKLNKLLEESKSEYQQIKTLTIALLYILIFTLLSLLYLLFNRLIEGEFKGEVWEFLLTKSVGGGLVVWFVTTLFKFWKSAHEIKRKEHEKYLYDKKQISLMEIWLGNDDTPTGEKRKLSDAIDIKEIMSNYVKGFPNKNELASPNNDSVEANNVAPEDDASKT